MNPMTEPHPSAAAFRAARDLLLRHRDDYAAAKREFSWPALEEFNWALDWFDVIAAEHPAGPRCGSWPTATLLPSSSFGELAARSEPGGQLAARTRGPPRRPAAADAGQHRPLWEVMLAAIKLGAVIIPATTLLGTGRPAPTG